MRASYAVVAGALLGNQAGKGHGREAATAVGAVLAAFAGDHVANRDRRERYEEVPREVTTCRTVLSPGLHRPPSGHGPRPGPTSAVKTPPSPRST